MVYGIDEMHFQCISIDIFILCKDFCVAFFLFHLPIIHEHTAALAQLFSFIQQNFSIISNEIEEEEEKEENEVEEQNKNH